MRPVPAWLVYPAALLLGLAFAIWLLSWRDIVPLDVLHAASIGDEAVSIVGQRYFLAQPWGWPLLLVPQLAWPDGVSIALTDSIPLAVLLLKPFRALVPPGASIAEAWLALALALQPVAAVFALRAAGERRALPAFAVAALAVTTPTLLNRSGHMALCTHAAILCALGLYFVLVRPGPPPRSGGGLAVADVASTWCAATLLLAGCLLIHPYILAMAAAVLAAAPLTLMLRGAPGWWRAVAGYAASLALCGALAWWLGYGGNRPAPGFGFYSMNLLNPILPLGSTLFPSVTFPGAGGMGWEGYQYLGAGILLLLGITVVQAVRGRVGWRRHGGLLLVLAGLVAFSLSNIAYAGPFRLYHWRPIPAAIEQFRSTGRFFWPVAYTILVVGVATAARSLRPGLATAVLLAAVALQWVDTTGLRANLRQIGADRTVWRIDTTTLRPILAAHSELTLWPIFGCGATPDSAVDVQVMLLASETLMRTNTMNTARERTAAECDPAPTLTAPLRPGELRVLRTSGEAWSVPDAQADCRALDPFFLCSATPSALAGLPLPLASLPPGKTIADSAPAFRDALSQGWAVPEALGVWSDGGDAILRFRPAGPHATLTLDVEGLAPQPGGVQTVQAAVGGVAQGTWVIPDHVTQTRTLGLATCNPLVCVVELHISRPVRPVDRIDAGTNRDTRPLGIYLHSLRLDAQEGG